jgi:opacity protein-like surface antigen
MGGDVSLANFRLGIEGEYAGNHAGWDHVRSPTGRSFSADLKEETAYSARLGYELASGALLYARYGVACARFVTTWVKGGNRDNDIERDDRKDGQRWGIGMELPLGSHGLLRSEYSYTRYDDYTFTTSHDAADTMSFKHRVGAFRVGVGVNF